MMFDGLRIAIVGPVPPPAGGMAMQTRQLAELLAREGATVTVIAVNPPYRPAWLARIRFLRAVGRLVAYVAALWSSTANVQLMHVMANSGWSWHLFAVPAIAVARLRRLPVIVNYRGGGAASFMAAQHLLVRLALRGASRLIVPSGYLSEIFERYSIASEIVPNIVDIARFQPATQRRAATPHVVVTRNLEPIYDVDTALEAFRLVRQVYPDASMTIAGSGPERARLEQTAARLGLAESVTFSGSLDRDAMADLLRDADISLNPSLVDNMPNSVMEAMAAGVPVVSTAVGGVPFIIRSGETGMLVPPRDPDAMAQAVLRILAEPQLRAALCQAARTQAEQWSWSCVAARWSSVYSEALETFPSTASAHVGTPASR